MGDEELEDLLGKRVFGREHSVVWVREDSRLEDYGEVCKARHQNGVSEEKRERRSREEGKLTRCGHEILVALLFEHAEEIEDVEEEVFVGYG